uniref:Uncharacterized protein n=1 Tax=Prolemur simus TaxID=1328070 RepID=A0A8C9A2F2_PROSS
FTVLWRSPTEHPAAAWSVHPTNTLCPGALCHWRGRVAGVWPCPSSCNVSSIICELTHCEGMVLVKIPT